MTAAADRELRRRRRAIARAHHPDLGGDAAELIAAWRRLDQAAGLVLDDEPSLAPGGRSAAGPEVSFVRRRRGLARWTPWVAGRLARRRTAVPRR